MPTYRDWVRRAQSGDQAAREAAFERIVRDFRGMAYGLAYSRLSDSQLAEDAAQEAFLTAYERIAQLKDASAFPAWLRRIVLNHSDRLLRRQGPPLSSIDEQERLASAEPSPEAQFEARELRLRVRAAVAALPAIARDVTHDYYLRGDSQREIAERLNIPLATVKKRLQYARAHLRNLLTGFSETFDRTVYGELPSSKEFQPVYIYRRRPTRKE